MTVANQPAMNRKRPKIEANPWSIGALLISALVLMPILSVVWIAFHPEENIWPHLIRTTLPRYLSNSVTLMLAVAALSSFVGAGTAWLLSMYRFPLSRWLEWLLFLPLAIPAYVGAYALVDFLEYAGPVQGALRDMFGWQSARDYWFPEIRSRGGAILVLSFALYPYVYLLTRTAFREQSGSIYEVAQALGAGAFGRFWRVGLPLARPAIAAGAAIVMMETVNDFGVVEFFAVQTLTTGIFSVWLESGNAGGAAQIASVVLILILALMAMEKFSRRRLRFHNPSRQPRPIVVKQLTGPTAWAASGLCLLPFLIGFALPVGVLLSHAISNESWFEPGLLQALINTLFVGGAAAVATMIAALFLVYGVRLSGQKLPRLLLPVTTIGYAAPGAVLAVGILIPLASVDHVLADGVENTFGVDVGLVLTGTAFALVYSYAVRFFAVAQGATESAMGRISPSLPMAARSLGRNARSTLWSVYLPLIRGSVGTGLLLVFVDCVKELPATLLLRPFNYDTLATRVYEKASLEDLGGAAPAALLVVGVGLMAVALLARTSRSV
ncbi:ABC transporter permease [Actibacterium pelagium]|uniref:Iron ABC transporter permease n=1 Tax=Actibacterium pelagium TaxID=2029103 RepID=A0A917ADU8_9RHOB|nr:iron ABC transporter permease [Actibacterium pelagium]GGE45711.1 iron ABC transporter permease [Actibacterium pelagium]